MKKWFITLTRLGTLNFFIFIAVGGLCALWVSKQNITQNLADSLFEESFSGDGYEPDCNPKMDDDGEITFGKFDPCNVHVTVMTMVFADGDYASIDTEEFKIVLVILAVAAIEAIMQLILVILSCTHKRAVDSFYVSIAEVLPTWHFYCNSFSIGNVQRDRVGRD